MIICPQICRDKKIPDQKCLFSHEIIELFLAEIPLACFYLLYRTSHHMQLQASFMNTICFHRCMCYIIRILFYLKITILGLILHVPKYRHEIQAIVKIYLGNFLITRLHVENIGKCSMKKSPPGDFLPIEYGKNSLISASNLSLFYMQSFSGSHPHSLALLLATTIQMSPLHKYCASAYSTTTSISFTTQTHTYSRAQKDVGKRGQSTFSAI